MWRQITSPNMKKCLLLGLLRLCKKCFEAEFPAFGLTSHTTQSQKVRQNPQQTQPNACPKPSSTRLTNTCKPVNRAFFLCVSNQRAERGGRSKPTRHINKKAFAGGERLPFKPSNLHLT